ncbi:transposase [Mesorhizobium sp. M0146]|uniref:transposase n=1 Tax=unclassified Mesorhizobium TaxID=325217 RepID=UPI003337509B
MIGPSTIEQHGPIRAWSVDDTPKNGKYSVGVACQHCGQLGKQDNCPIAVSLLIANDAASLPIAYQLYLPHNWAENPEQRKKAKIPAEITFRTKPRIAEGFAPGVVLGGAGYGAGGSFRAGLPCATPGWPHWARNSATSIGQPQSGLKYTLG